MIGEADTSDILAGRYVDGTWSYTQALYEAKKYGVSKRRIRCGSLCMASSTRRG